MQVVILNGRRERVLTLIEAEKFLDTSMCNVGKWCKEGWIGYYQFGPTQWHREPLACEIETIFELKKKYPDLSYELIVWRRFNGEL